MNLPETFTDRTARIEIASLVLAAIGLAVVLQLGLLTALLAGLLAHQCAQMLAARHRAVGVSRFGGKVIALTILGGIVTVALTYGTVRLANLLSGEEMPGASDPAPDQNDVDEIGRAAGLTAEDDDRLSGDGLRSPAELFDERDAHRWELDPRSSGRPGDDRPARKPR